MGSFLLYNEFVILQKGYDNNEYLIVFRVFIHKATILLIYAGVSNVMAVSIEYGRLMPC